MERALLRWLARLRWPGIAFDTDRQSQIWTRSLSPSKRKSLIICIDVALGGSGSTCVGQLQINYAFVNERPDGVSAWCFAVTDSNKVRVALEVNDLISLSPKIVIPATKQ